MARKNGNGRKPLVTFGEALAIGAGLALAGIAVFVAYDLVQGGAPYLLAQLKGQTPTPVPPVGTEPQKTGALPPWGEDK